MLYKQVTVPFSLRQILQCVWLQAQFTHGLTVSTLLDHNRPDMVVLEKARRVCEIIDVACPFDIRIVEKERERIPHYQDLKVEMRKMWNC